VRSRLGSTRLVDAHDFEGGVCPAGHPATDKVAALDGEEKSALTGKDENVCKGRVGPT
jgi:hypothetical protein